MFRRRRGMRPTTEAGARYERCNFTFGFLHDVSPTGSPSSDSVQLISGQSMIESMNLAGTEAASVARMLQNPLRDFEVKALVFDVEAFPVPFLTGDPPDLSNQVVHGGIAVYTQQLDADGAPVTLPPYWLSQWPVNLGTTGVSQFNEDRDYATRTHLDRAFAIYPGFTWTTSIDPITNVAIPYRPYRQYVRLKINRRLGDKYGLFFGVWTSNAGVTGMQTNGLQFLVHGSLWYKMKF